MHLEFFVKSFFAGHFFFLLFGANEKARLYEPGFLWIEICRYTPNRPFSGAVRYTSSQLNYTIL